PLVPSLPIAANVAGDVLTALPLGARPPAANDPALHEYVRVMSHAVANRAELQQILTNVSLYDLVVFRWGFRPAAPSAVDALTCMFLHVGFLHLFGNMLFLWIYGDNVEHRLGSVQYLCWYLGTGIVATLFHMLGAAGSELPLVGAS